jgi:lysophospholipase L1-like esterase
MGTVMASLICGSFAVGAELENANSIPQTVNIPDAKFMNIAPNDPRLEYTDCAHVDATVERARLDRLAESSGMRYDNPGARIRFVTDAAAISAKFLYNGLHQRLDALNQEGFLFVDGKKNGTFTAGASRPGEVTASFAPPADGKMHLCEILLPYGDSVDFCGLNASSGAHFDPAGKIPPRPKFRYVAYGDSITHGFRASDLLHSYPFLIAEANGWQCVNMGFGSRDATPEDGAVVGELVPDLVTVLLGVNDCIGKKPLETFSSQMSAFLDKLQARAPQAGIYLITPLSVPGKSWPVDHLEEFRAALRLLAQGRSRVHLVEGPQLVPGEPRYFQDGLHPNDAGFAIMAERLSAQIQQPQKKL